MIVDASKYIAALLFGVYMFLDVACVYPRVAGAEIGKNGLGYTFQLMMNTIKRVAIVAYPPFLGILAAFGQYHDFIFTIALSYILAMIAIVICIYARSHIIIFFRVLISSYEISGRLLVSFVDAIRAIRNVEKYQLNARSLSLFSGKRMPEIVGSASLIYFFYAGSIFIINIISFVFSRYSSIILQSVGLVNAFGTLGMAFYLDPKISRIYEIGVDIDIAERSIIQAHLINIFIISPIFFSVFLYILY